MKVVLRVPTKEQYAYIEVESEVDNIEEAIEQYQKATNIIHLEKHEGGISEKEFNAFLDKYLTENTGDVEVYNKMSDEQKNIVQTIKRSLKRIEYKNK